MKRAKFGEFIRVRVEPELKTALRDEAERRREYVGELVRRELRDAFMKSSAPGERCAA